MADTEYIISIASRLNGVDATQAQLDSLVAKLDGSGAKSAAFGDAITALSADLSAAATATAAANATLASARTEYAQLEVAAARAADAVTKLQTSNPLASLEAGVAKAAAALRAIPYDPTIAGFERMKAAQDRLVAAQGKLDTASAAHAASLSSARSAASAAAGAVADYATKLDKAEREARQADGAQKQLASTLANTQKLQQRVNETLARNKEKMSAVRGALGNIGGPLGGLLNRITAPAQAYTELTEKFGAGTAVMSIAGITAINVAVQLATALLAVGAAAGAALIALTMFAIKTVDAARSLALTREAAAILEPALRGIPWDAISRDTGVAGDRLSALSKALLGAKVSAAELPEALRAAAAAEAALGQGGADAFIARMNAGKLSVRDFANEVSSKFGDIVARRMLGLEAQSMRFRANLGDLFSGLDIEPALKGLRTLVSLFDSNTAAGRFMKRVLTGILQPIIDGARTAAYVVEAFVLGLMIGGAKIYKSLRPVIAAVSSMLGLDASSWSLESVLRAVSVAAEYLAPVLALAAVGLGVLVVAIVGALGVVAAFAGAIVIAGGVVITAFVAAVTAASAFVGRLIGLIYNGAAAVAGAAGQFASAGLEIIAGLVSGITSGASSVVSAITGVVGSAVNAAKAALGIASPSKVFAEIGTQTGEGFTGGVEGETANAQNAIDALTSPSISSPAMSTSTSTTTTKSQITIGSVTFPGGAEAVAAFQAWLETLALQGGAA